MTDYLTDYSLLVGSDTATPESNIRDMEAIRETGSKDLIDKFITDNIPYAISKVESYIREHPSFDRHRDELIGVALEGLTEAVYDLAKRETPKDGGNPSAFIGRKIFWHIQDFVKQEIAQNVPEDYIPKKYAISDQCNINDHNIFDIAVNPVDIIDFEDTLAGICETVDDMMILNMRAENQTDSEIADALGITRRMVSQRRAELQQRYLEQYSDD